MRASIDIDKNMMANNLTPECACHPGEVLREEIDSRHITQTQLANELGMRVSLLNEIIKGKRNITIEYAMMLEAALGIDADFWITMQTNYDSFKAKQNTIFMEKLSKIRRIAAAL